MRKYFAFLWLLLACAAQPAAAASSPRLGTLEQQLRSLVAGKSADVGIAALDLTNGETVSVNGDKSFPMASTMKVAVAANYLQQVDAGNRSLTDRISGQTAASLMERMLIHSDNNATDILIRDLGGAKGMQEWVAWHRLSNMRIDRNIAKLLADKRDLWDVRDSSTPVAMVQMLKMIDKGSLLKPASRAYLLDIMGRCATGKNRMRALLPWGTRVEHKTGTLNGYASDVGFITLPNGHRVAVAFFTRGGGDRPNTIAQAARAVYDGFTRVLSWPSFGTFQPSTGQ
jgi:beta-lactamase class A